MQIIKENFHGIELGEAVVHQQMAMFPLISKRTTGEPLRNQQVASARRACRACRRCCGSGGCH